MALNLDPSSVRFPGSYREPAGLPIKAFKSEFTSLIQKLRNIFCEEDRIPDHPGRLFQQLFKLRLSFFDR